MVFNIVISSFVPQIRHLSFTPAPGRAKILGSNLDAYHRHRPLAPRRAQQRLHDGPRAGPGRSLRPRTSTRRRAGRSLPQREEPRPRSRGSRTAGAPPAQGHHGPTRSLHSGRLLRGRYRGRPPRRVRSHRRRRHHGGAHRNLGRRRDCTQPGAERTSGNRHRALLARSGQTEPPRARRLPRAPDGHRGGGYEHHAGRLRLRGHCPLHAGEPRRAGLGNRLLDASQVPADVDRLVICSVRHARNDPALSSRESRGRSLFRLVKSLSPFLSLHPSVKV